jgi:hypothetical protein
MWRQRSRFIAVRDSHFRDAAGRASRNSWPIVAVERQAPLGNWANFADKEISVPKRHLRKPAAAHIWLVGENYTIRHGGFAARSQSFPPFSRGKSASTFTRFVEL